MNLVTTITMTYKANPEFYPEGSTIEEIAAIEEQNFIDDPKSLIETMHDAEYDVAVSAEAAQATGKGETE